MTLKQIAEECEVSISCARAICTKIQMGISDEDIVAVKKGRKSSPNENLKCKIRTLIHRDPSHTLRSINEELNLRNISAAPPTIAKYLKQMEFTRKRLSLVPLERNSMRNVDARQEYCQNINSVRDSNLVFLDETGFNLHTKKQYGYSIKNTKAYLTAPANRGKNMSLMCFIDVNGVVA